MTSFNFTSPAEGTESSPQQVSDKGLVAIIYALYIVGFFTGITAIIGVLLAHANIGAASGVVAAHYRYQIRTFWWGFLMLVVGAVLSIVLVGYLVLLGWFVWTAFRIVNGLSALNRGHGV